MLRLILIGLMTISFTLIGTSSSLAAYYNSMITGGDRSIMHCQKIYDGVISYRITVIKDCGFGIDATCNKRIKYDKQDGIDAVRNDFNQVINNLELNLAATVNSKNSCQF